MVKRVTKDLLGKSAIVDDDKFAISDSQDLLDAWDPESWNLKRISWWELKDLFINNTVTFVVTTAFLSWEIIDITDGTWATAWVTTRTIWDTGDIITLWSAASVFNANASFRVIDNKTTALKDTDVIWDSSTSFHFIRPLEIWEWFIIEDGTSSWGGTIWDTTIEGTLDVTWDTTLQWDVTITWDITKSWSTVWSVITYVDDSGWDSTINLPTAVWLLNQSFTYIRTDTSINTTTIDANWTELINNSLTFTFWKGESVTIISDDSNWFII